MAAIEKVVGGRRYDDVYVKPKVLMDLASVDREIGRIVDCLDANGQLAETALFVIGDVAYQPVHTQVSPNIALVRRGLIGRDPRSSTGIRSWLAVVRSHGRSAYVYAKDGKNAVEARSLLEAEAKKTGAFAVVSAGDLAKAGADPQAWFGLIAAPGFVIGNEMVGPSMIPADLRGAAGGLREPGETSNSVGFVAWGRGIRRQIRIPTFDLEDIAPTIARLIGLRLDEGVDGQPLVGLLRAAVPAPPPGPKRLGADPRGKPDQMIREFRKGRGAGLETPGGRRDETK